MEGTAHSVTMWRKSTYSGGNGGNCVEIGGSGPAVLVRDTKNRSSTVLTFGPAQWRRFTTAIKDTDKA